MNWYWLISCHFHFHFYFSYCWSWFLVWKRSRYSGPSLGLFKIWYTWTTDPGCSQALWKGTVLLITLKSERLRLSKAAILFALNLQMETLILPACCYMYMDVLEGFWKNSRFTLHQRLGNMIGGIVSVYFIISPNNFK